MGETKSFPLFRLHLRHSVCVFGGKKNSQKILKLITIKKKKIKNELYNWCYQTFLHSRYGIFKTLFPQTSLPILHFSHPRFVYIKFVFTYLVHFDQKEMKTEHIHTFSHTHTHLLEQTISDYIPSEILNMLNETETKNLKKKQKIAK